MCPALLLVQLSVFRVIVLCLEGCRQSQVWDGMLLGYAMGYILYLMSR